MMLNGNQLALLPSLVPPAAPGPSAPDPPAAFAYQQGIAPGPAGDGSYVVAPQSLFGSTSDDAVWINNAIVQAAASTGGSKGAVVHLMPLQYNLLSPIVIANDAVTLQGSGRATVLNAAAGFTGTPIIWAQAPAVSGFRLRPQIKDLLINTAVAGLVGIQLDSTYFAQVERVDIEGVYAISISLADGGTGRFGAYTRIKDCHLGSTPGGPTSAGTGIKSANHERWIVEGCTINWFAQSGGIGIYVANTACYISGNDFDECDTGVEVFFCDTTHVINNDFDRGVTQFLLLRGSTRGLYENNSFGSFVGTGSQNMITLTNDGGRVANVFFANQAQSGSTWTNFVSEAGGSGSSTDPDVYLANDTKGFGVVRSFGVFRQNNGYNPIGKISSAPAVAASGTAVTNQTGYDAMVIVTLNAAGGATSISLGGQATGITSAVASAVLPPVRVPALETITLTYTNAPTWVWFGD